jgi:predicted transcriptional regulator
MVLSDDEIELDEALRNLVAKGLIEEVPGGYRITERGIGCYETHLDKEKV